MAVTVTDMKIRLSGGASNAIPAAALGGIMSSVGITSGADENLFDNVSAGEATSGDTEYRCFYVFNANATDTINDVKVWINSNTPSPASAATIGLDPAGVGNGSTTGVATTIANESTAPAGVTFFPAANSGAALAIGNLAPLTGRAVWAKRVIDAAAPAYAGDGFQLAVSGLPV